MGRQWGGCNGGITVVIRRFFPLGFFVRYLGSISRLHLLVESINGNPV